MAKRLKRSEVPIEMTWDLTDLYESREIWQEKLAAMAPKIAELASYKGRLAESSKVLLECLLLLEKTAIEMTQLGTYARLKQSGDGTDPVNQEDTMAFSVVNTQFGAASSFVEAEIIGLDDERYQAIFEEEEELKDFKIFLDKIISKKQYQLSPDTEEALAAMGELMTAPYRIYSISKAADMKFDSFKDENGVEYPNSFALFEGKYEAQENETIRTEAYASFVKTLKAYHNTYAAVYATEVRKQIAERKLRGYEDVFEMLLEPQYVSKELYENQLDVIFHELAPHMRKMAKIKEKQLGLDHKIRFCDLKAPLPIFYNAPVTIDSVRDIIVEALAVLGEDYQGMIKRAFADRWIDYGDNIGKSTGAFCSSPYGVHPYVLVTYTGTMRSAFLLSHELGHAGNSYNVQRAQRVFDSRLSMYFSEAPSTMNEMLVAQYLMGMNDDPALKHFVITNLLGTYYHNFVTHLLEGEFQRRVYLAAEKGVALTAKWLSATKLAVIREFWGDAVDVDDDAGMTWMRQPHYYMGLYPYSYSAGLTVATIAAQNIKEEGQPAVDRWLQVLRTGGTLTPVEVAKLAGVDMTTPQPIKDTVAYVGSLIDELGELYETLG